MDRDVSLLDYGVGHWTCFEFMLYLMGSFLV